MAAGRPLLGLISLIILAGGVLLQFLVILSGGVNSSPEDRIYFLEASTNGINSARNPSRWTFFAICGVADGRNSDCGASVPALPFDPPRNFGTESGIPPDFIGAKRYYYLSRFMFAFYLIALFFAVVALFTGLLALCSRLGGYISGLNSSIALFFQTITAALMTAWTVKGRNAFRAAGRESHLGVYAFAFTWAAMACFLISTVLFCCGGAIGDTPDAYQLLRVKPRWWLPVFEEDIIRLRADVGSMQWFLMKADPKFREFVRYWQWKDEADYNRWRRSEGYKKMRRLEAENRRVAAQAQRRGAQAR